MNDPTKVTFTENGSSATIVGAGTLDLTNSQEFEDGLRQASHALDKVTVDLRLADFIDTKIVQDLARAAIALLHRGKRLTVLADEQAYPLRVLRISGFQEIMDIEVGKTAQP